MSRIFRLGLDTQGDLATQFAKETWPLRIKRITRAQGVHTSPAHLWCVDHFGPCGSTIAYDSFNEPVSVRLDPALAWANTGRHFMFRDPDHAFEFKMAWG